MDERMREAAQVGNIHALYALIQEDPFVLERIDRCPFIDTPLHIAASEGHIDFAMEMMNLKPSYARKLNPTGFSPMHLALSNSQTLVVRELLKVEKDLVRVKGRNGLTPLHFAAENRNRDVIAEKENWDVIAEFLKVCPECITDATIHNQTAFHIAAINNNFETLELLVCWLQKTTHKYADIWNKQVLNKKDREGNTVLHIAAAMNQSQMVRLLLNCTMISKNEVNLNGLSALDMLQGQVNNNETVDTLRQAGCLEAKRMPARQTFAESLRSRMSWSQKLRRTMTRQSNMISNDMRNAMLVVAVLILTATYQTCLTPPGGVWQGNVGDNDFGNTMPTPSEAPTPALAPPKTKGFSFSIGSHHNKDTNDSLGSHHNNDTNDKVGLSVMSTTNFLYFYIINTATFLTTTCVVFFLLPDQTINLLTLPVLLFILCYLLSMIYLAPFPIGLFFPVLQPISPIIVATLVFLVVCLPKFFNLYSNLKGLV